MPSVLILAVVLGIYGLIIVGLAWVLRGVRIAESRAVFLGFLIFGLSTGIIAVALWPMDISVYPNVLAAWVGDWIYVHAIEFIGNSHSDQAHYTIPWSLRVPQVYALASCVLFAALGMATQWLYNRRPRRGSSDIANRRQPSNNEWAGG
jgi:hypothetical protein